MHHRLRWFALTALLLAACSRPEDASAPPSSAQSRYIVVLEDTLRAQSAEAFALSVDRTAAALGVQAQAPLRVINGFVAALGPTDAARLAQDARVKYVEPDRPVSLYATQSSAPWGLDRIDQTSLPLSGSYRYTATAPGVTAYIIDTGIRFDHSDFGGRVVGGVSAVSDGRGASDCDGHGTHVAGTVGGATYGVAKSVKLFSVRVLDCYGEGTNAGVIAGIDWVTYNHQKPAVANMSLGGGASQALDDAVRASVAAGVTYVVAAGNDNQNACNVSPARVGAAVTVGATTRSDSRASFSNYGSCLDLFAPGQDIRSAAISSSTASQLLSGTSMAAPHAAGAAALYLQSNPGASPSAVASDLVSTATTGKVTSRGSNSPNRLLYKGTR